MDTSRVRILFPSCSFTQKLEEIIALFDRQNRVSADEILYLMQQAINDELEQFIRSEILGNRIFKKVMEELKNRMGCPITITRTPIKLKSKSQDAPCIASGFNSRVLLEKSDSPYEYQVVKEVGEKRGGLAFLKAPELIEEIKEYQHQLEVIGIPIPPIKDIAIEYSPLERKAVILLRSPWTGEDVEAILLSPQAHNQEKIKRIIKAMCRIVLIACTHTNEDGQLLVGIDAKANNFTVATDSIGNQTMWYVDQFPPHYWKDGHPIIEWIPLKSVLGNELGRFKYFDWRGVFLTLTSQLSRIRPLLKEHIEAIALTEFGKQINAKDYNRFCEQFTLFPWIILRHALRKENIEQAISIIQQCITQDICGIRYSVYTLREIALELAMHQVISYDELRDIFSALHYEDEEFAPHQWKDTQQDLCQFVRRA